MKSFIKKEIEYKNIFYINPGAGESEILESFDSGWYFLDENKIFNGKFETFKEVSRAYKIRCISFLLGNTWNSSEEIKKC